MVGNWISAVKTFHVLPERDYGRKVYAKSLGWPARILFTGILQSVSLISLTMGVFYHFEGNCSVTRKLLWS